MRTPTLIALAALGLGAAACATAPVAYGPPPPRSTAFNAADFGWSARPGSAAIEGRVDYRRDGRVYDCTGSVGLTPDTPYTRARFATLYGSTDRAAIPEAVVRARTVPDPNADYRSYVRQETCDGGRFRFTGLPDGGWFVIVPVAPADGADRTVLMRHVVTRGGRVDIVL